MSRRGTYSPRGGPAEPEDFPKVASGVPQAVATPPRPRPRQPKLTPEDRAHLLKVDPMTGLTEFERRKCEHCGGVHTRECARVKRKVERIGPDGGRTVEVEYWRQDEWENPHVIWPEMLGIVDPREVGG